MEPITTTLRAIRQHRPCGLEIGSNYGYQKLRKFLGKGYGDETPIRFSTIIESNGVDDAFWCLRTLPEDHHPRIRLLLADVAERVLPLYEKEYPNCDKPRKCIEAARAYVRGEITKEELDAARDAARAAALAAADAAARVAARDAARAAADAAARVAARYAALSAAEAAWDAALSAAEAAWDAAALDAERKAQGELLIKYFG